MRPIMSRLFKNPAYSEVRLESPPPYEIFVPDSDVEDDSAKRAAKRRRTEEHAHKYLQGKPLFIASASLKGPFDKGWKNPWQKPRRCNTAVKSEKQEDKYRDQKSSLAEQNAQAEREERKRQLREQRLQRAAVLQQDGHGKIVSDPIDLMAEDEVPALAASRSRSVPATAAPSNISAHTKAWLKRQRPPSSTPDPPHDGDDADETPSKPPRTPSSRPSSSHSAPKRPVPHTTKEAHPTPRASAPPSPRRPPETKPAVQQTHDAATTGKDCERRGQLPELNWPSNISSPGHPALSSPKRNAVLQVSNKQLTFQRSDHILDQQYDKEGRYRGDHADVAPVDPITTVLEGHCGDNFSVNEQPQSEAILQNRSDPVVTRQQSPSRKNHSVSPTLQKAPARDPNERAHQRSRTPSQSPAKHHSGFTPINQRFESPIPDLPVTARDSGQEALEPPQDHPAAETLPHEDYISGQEANVSFLEGLLEAKLLSQKAVEQALCGDMNRSPTPASSPSADVPVLVGLMSAKRLAQDAISRDIGDGAQSDRDRASFRQALRESAERCVTTREPTKTGKTTGKKKPINSKKASESLESRPPIQLAVVDEETTNALPPRRYALNASPTTTDSPGFAYQKVANAVNTSGPSAARSAAETSTEKKPQPQKKKPRKMTFASSPVDALPNKSSDEQSKPTSHQQPETTSEQTGTSTSNPNASGIQPSPSSHISIPDHQDSTAYSLSNRDLSTQAAVILAQEAFREELISPVKEPPEPEPELAADADQTFLSPTKIPQTGTITPFRAFHSSPMRQSPANHIIPRAPIATQDLFNAASPFAVSTVKKPKQGKRASFAASAPEEQAPAPDHDAIESSFWAAQPTNAAQTPTLVPVAMTADPPTAPSSTDEASVTMSIIPPDDPPPPICSASPTRSPTRQQMPLVPASFSTSPYVSLKEASFQDGQKLLDDSQFDIDAALEDAESFLQSWDLESEIRKSGSKNGSMASTLYKRKTVSVRNH